MLLFSRLLEDLNSLEMRERSSKVFFVFVFEDREALGRGSEGLGGGFMVSRSGVL